MKIHYSPHFDRNPFIDFQKRDNLIFNEMVVGDKGLLNELELRSGLVCETLSDVEREANYYNVLRQVIDNRPESFISKSFDVDEYGVASQLLKWRDELVLAGWKPDMIGISDKLDLIAEVEKTAVQNGINIKGESDRWKAIFESDARFLEDGDELLVYFPEHLLPPWLADFFNKLAEKGARCAYQVIEKNLAPDNTNLGRFQKALLKQGDSAGYSFSEDDRDSLRMMRFERFDDAMEYMVNQEAHAGRVYVNSDNRNFDNLQDVFNKPQSGSILKDASPEIVQLFKLGLSLFVSPLNIYNLLSYLQIHVHPLPAKLRHKLIDVIIEEGGIVNKKWEKAIDDFRNAEDPKEANKNKKKLNFLPVNTDFTQEIPVTAMKDYVNQLRTWAHQQRHLRMDDSENLVTEALSSLVNLCNAFQVILNSQTDEKIFPDKLKSWILSIYRPSNYTYTTAQAGSGFVISSPAAMLDPADEVIWMDCFDGTPQASLFRFLTHEEFNSLKNKGMKLLGEEEQVQAQLYEQERAVLQCTSQCTLLVSTKNRGERVNEHPLVTRLQTQFNHAESIVKHHPEPTGQMEQIEKHSLPETSLSFELDQKNLFTPRKRESYSSLSDLIQNPLDYVFNYQLKLSDPGINELGNEKRTMGNVAHLFIEELVDETKGDLAAMKSLVWDKFWDLFDNAVMQKGAVLLLEENKILHTRFAFLLEKSVHNLLEILETNNLQVEGVEVNESCWQSSLFELEANIDLLLKDKNGRPVIFDLKWTDSKDYYNKLIQENRALQLEVYRKVLNDSREDKTRAVAYYNLKQGRLITSSGNGFKGNHVIQLDTENNGDIFEQAMNAYQYRWNQLGKGIIEVAEGMEMNNLDYVMDMEQKNLYPLEKDYNNKKIKAANPFSNFRTFKGGLK